RSLFTSIQSWSFSHDGSSSKSSSSVIGEWCPCEVTPAAWRYWPQSAARLGRMYAGRGLKKGERPPAAGRPLGLLIPHSPKMVSVQSNPFGKMLWRQGDLSACHAFFPFTVL